MVYWIREIAGWLLVLVALGMTGVGVVFLSDPEAPRIVEAGIVMFAGMGVLRMGILLVRVSTAARICLKEQSGSQS